MLSVGLLLKQARENQKITLTQVQKNTRIRLHLLHAIESENWNAFPSKIYVEGVIKSYAKYLGLSPEKILAFFRRDYEKNEDIGFRKRLKPAVLHPESRRVMTVIVTAIVLIFIFYFGYLLYGYLTPPSVIFTSPKQTTFRNTDRITITGHTEKEANVEVMGEQVFLDKQGNFQYELPLHKGINMITFDITGGNGKKTTVTKTFILE